MQAVMQSCRSHNNEQYCFNLFQCTLIKCKHDHHVPSLRTQEHYANKLTDPINDTKTN